MSSSSLNKRPRLRDIVRGNIADFQRVWTTTEASDGFDPLPPGVYRCLIADGQLSTSKPNATPGYKITFEVIVGPSAGRKVWHDVWLSSKALPIAKAELAKLGITSPDQLEHPLPPGLTADVTVVQRTGDDGTTYNRVKTFEVVDVDVPADDFAPSSEENSEEADDATASSPLCRAPREPGLDDDLDADGFDWKAGVQVKQVSPEPRIVSRSNGRVVEIP